MKLEPKSKPVKFRIKVGGAEHDTLESLRRHFVWADVKELLDGRLEKWLRRINETEKADNIYICANGSKFEIYSILFYPNKPIKALEGLLRAASSDVYVMPFAEECLKEEKTERLIELAGKCPHCASVIGKILASSLELKDLKSAVKAIRISEKIKDPNFSETIKDAIIQVAQDIIKSKSSQDDSVFIFAKYIYEQFRDHKKIGEQIIVTAADKGNKQAEKYCKEHKINRVSKASPTAKLAMICSNPSYQNAVKECFPTHYYEHCSCAPLNDWIIENTSISKGVLAQSFVNACISMSNLVNNKLLPSRAPEFGANITYLLGVKKNDPLFRAAQFLLCISRYKAYFDQDTLSSSEFCAQLFKKEHIMINNYEYTLVKNPYNDDEIKENLEHAHMLNFLLNLDKIQ